MEQEGHYHEEDHLDHEDHYYEESLLDHNGHYHEEGHGTIGFFKINIKI